MKKHLRIAALQCNFQTPEATLNMPKKWSEFGFNTEQLLHTHADMYSAVYDPNRHGALMDEYQKQLKANGMRSIVYMNCHILGPSIADRKEEWGLQDENGGFPLRYWTYPGVCLNSGWVDYFYAGLESLAKYDIEGLFFDGPMYTPVCWCPRCQAKFEAKYGKSFKEATPAEREKFYYDDVIEFKDNLYKKVKSINPNWVMYFNEGLEAGRADAKDFARQLASDDIIGTEGGFFFYEPPKSHPQWYCSSLAKMAEGLAGDKPTVIFFAGDHKAWGWYMHTPAESRLCYMSALGNGASVWYGIHCNPDNLNTKTGAAVKELVQFDKKYDELYQDTQSMAETAVFFSFNTARYYRKSGISSDLYAVEERKTDFPGDYHAAVQGAYAICSHTNTPYDIVTELNLKDLPRYKVLFAPSLAMVSDEVVKALGDYVAAGGVVIADGEFGLYDETGKKRPESAFSQLAGFRPTGKLNDNNIFNYCGVNADIYQPDNAFNWMPVPPWSLEINASDDAEVIGHATPPMPGCYFSHPGQLVKTFATKRNHGKGSFLYLSGGCFEFYFDYTHVAWRELFQALLNTCLKSEYRVLNGTTGLMVSVRKSVSGGCVLMHLTNYTSMTRPITKSAPLHNLEIEVPASCTQITDLWTGKALAKSAPGKFILDEIQEVAVLKIEFTA